MKKFIRHLLLSLTLFCGIANAEEVNVDNTILINADEVLYNNAIKVINAFGNVEIVKDNSIVWADEVTYNKAQDLIIAKGNITLKSSDGSVSYGSYMEFNNAMKTGFVKSPQARLIDDTRVAGSSVTRENESVTIMKNAVYSPCEVCESKENPIWQIKAKEIKSNEETMNIEYRNAWLEVYGTPILYTPYLTHPDPRVKRRSGWLTPSVENSSDVGFMFRNYYYWDIQDNTDATIEFTTLDLTDTPLLGAEIRHIFNNGELNISGSATVGETIDHTGKVADSDSLQGHIFADGKFDINDYWRASFEIQGVTDDNYFEFYNFDTEDEDMLTSKAKLEGFYGDDYLALKGYKFTDLRPNIEDKQPIILPFAEYDFNGHNFLGTNSNWLSTGDIMTLDQEGEAKELRLYNQTGIEQSFLSKNGISLDVNADLYTRAYVIDQEDKSKEESIFEVMPQLYMLAKYPLAKTNATGTTTIIEPVANLIIAPNGANHIDKPIEDSTILDLDYTNLFSKNRLSGVDRLEDGIRSSYGVKLSSLNTNGGYSSLFLGQAYRHRENRYLFSEESALGDKFSDIILEMQLKPNGYINLDYSALLDKDELSDKKHEAYFSIGKDLFRVLGSYIYNKENYENTTNDTSQELQLAFSSVLNDYWVLSGASTSSLGADGEGLLKASLNLEYIDECFSLGLYGERDLTNRKGAQSATTIMLRVGLKNIGELKSPTMSTDFLRNDELNKD